ncbi:hypothetical protein S7711_07798 [Stachybotrys chartarum IBT 7711]|uniref:Major facilitator superfamily (MFS) profile domain-containing protein n=1 Tax=Stachybotrys chartarum (strain CBS 109288 / IBT 7711) TaxID=1280523 RepID=A0A084ASP6_STACB|nr:hypothetical protein S7711_07798 [Stachybotrys chartarum IBT 7711]
MDVRQVTSHAVHDEDDHGYKPDAVTTAPPARDDSQQNTDLEKRTAEASAAPIPETYPEGGLKAWMVVVGSWATMLSSLGLMNTIAIFHSYTHNHQLSHYNEDTIGWIFSIYSFLAFACGIYIGPIFDKYGPKWLIIAGVICTVSGTVAMSFSYELWHFILSFGVLCGLGTSLIFTPSVAAIGHWFKARRSFATGMACTAGGIGGIIFPLMLSSLFDRVGFGWATRALALICLVCGSVGIMLVQSRLPPSSNANAHPDFRIFRQTPFLFATMGIFMMEFALFIPLTYAASYAVFEGFSQDFAFQLIPILNAASVVGRALPGYYGDVIGPFNVCIMAVLMCIISILCVWLPSGHTTPGIILFVVLWGFASGTNISIAPVCIGMLCKTNEYGRYYATSYTIVSVACLIGVPIAGAIVRASGGQCVGLIVFTASINALAAVFLFLAKVFKLGWQNWRAIY